METSSSTIHDKPSESFILIWLNPSVNSVENIEIQQKFLEFIRHLKIFTKSNECEKYIQSSTQERFVLIVSGQMGREIVPRIHQLKHILSIYVFCMDRETHIKWSKEYKKVKGVVVKSKDLIDGIRLEHERSNHNKANELLSISIFKKNIDENEIINGPNGDFLYMKYLINSLLQLKPTEGMPKEFLDLCQEEYKTNPIELDNIDQFKKDYSSDQALIWFTKNNFLSKMINNAFYHENINFLFLSRFFLHDLQQQIKQNQSLTSIRVYRSQLISKTLLEKFQNSIGQYILIASFFSANINREQALSDFDYNNNSSENLQQILFEIHTDPIVSFCYSSNDEEILFNLDSIFHLVDIEFDENQFWIIRMILCNDKDLNLPLIMERIKTNEKFWTTDLLLFGTVLQEKKKDVEAEKFYRLLLNELSHDHEDIDACYYSLGVIADEKEDYDTCLKYYQLSLQILLRKNQLNHPNLGIIYYKIAEIYRKQNQDNEALESYNKSLTIWKDPCNNNQRKLVDCLNNIALIYRIEKKYLEAFSYYTEALHISEKYLSINHIDLGILNHNIGALHWCLGHYDKAIKCYNLALEIKCKSLSSEHSSIAMTLENLGLIYENNEDVRRALDYYEQAAEIYRKTLSQTHPDVVQIDEALQRVSLTR